MAGRATFSNSLQCVSHKANGYILNKLDFLRIAKQNFETQRAIRSYCRENERQLFSLTTKYFSVHEDQNDQEKIAAGENGLQGHNLISNNQLDMRDTL